MTRRRSMPSRYPSSAARNWLTPADQGPKIRLTVPNHRYRQRLDAATLPARPRTCSRRRRAGATLHQIRHFVLTHAGERGRHEYAPGLQRHTSVVSFLRHARLSLEGARAVEGAARFGAQTLVL